MLNIPNILSIFRLCLVPVFVLAFFSGGQYARVLAVAVYCFATITDFLDGYIARKYNLITNLGKVLDPLGDKMFTFSVLVCMYIQEIIPGWLIVVFFVKEMLMGIGGVVLHRKAGSEIPPSNILGKTATVVFFVICVILLLVERIPSNVAVIMVGGALLISIMALVSYLMKFINIMKKKKGSC